jgi:hypothetical protein
LRSQGKPIESGIEAAAPLPSPKHPLAWLGQRAFRLVLVGCVVWIGWFTMTSLSEVCSSPRMLSGLPSKAQPQPHSRIPDLSSLTCRGRWLFAGIPVGVRLMGWDKERTVEAMNAVPTDLPGSSGQREWSVALKLMQSMKCGTRLLGNVVVHELDRRAVMARVFTLGPPGKERVLAARLALFSGQGWILLESAPDGKDSVPPPPLLLPLPSTVRRVCDRYDDEGRLRVNVVSIASTWTDVRRFWRDQGWTVEQTAADENQNDVCECCRDEETIHVLAQGNPDERGHLILMFIRTSSTQVNHE